MHTYIFQAQDVPKNVLGMEDRFEKLKKTVIEKSEKTCGFQLRGQGGCGKTLLAKNLNNDEDIHGVFGEHSILRITVGRDALISDKYKIMRRFLGVPERSAEAREGLDRPAHASGG